MTWFVANSNTQGGSFRAKYVHIEESEVKGPNTNMSACKAICRAQCVLRRKKFLQWSTAEVKHERETIKVATQQRLSPGKGISKHIVGAKTSFTTHLFYCTNFIHPIKFL